MSIESDIPVPIRFNPLKHHRNYMLEILSNSSPEEIISLLDPVCNNYNDIYTGTLAPEAIGRAIANTLKSKQVFLPEAFSRWVDSNQGYRTIKLEDHSEWVVRRSNEEERYIHLHPSRNGLNTVRFKGSTLKTVFLLKARQKDSTASVSLENVNQVRVQIGLSPIKKLDRNKGILNCLEKFFSPA